MAGLQLKGVYRLFRHRNAAMSDDAGVLPLETARLPARIAAPFLPLIRTRGNHEARGEDLRAACPPVRRVAPIVTGCYPESSILEEST